MKKFYFLFILTLLLVACDNSNTEEATVPEEGSSENTEGETSASEEGSSENTEAAWAPEQNIEFVAPSAAGGGWDTTARMIAQVANENDISDQSIGVVNREGGSGAVGWSYISELNNPHNIFITNPQIITSPLMGISDLGFEDFTPIANMVGDYAAFAVSADSEWDSLDELMDDLRENPSEISVIGNSVAGGLDHLQFLIIAEAAGIDPASVNYIATQDGSALTSVMNGNADVYTTGVAEVIEQVRAGNVKVLGITSEERLEGDVVSDFPTAIEQGIDATFINWRGFYGPQDMSDAEVDYYSELLKNVSESEEFDEIRNQFGWADMYMDTEEFETHVEEEYESYQSILNDLDMLEE